MQAGLVRAIIEPMGYVGLDITQQSKKSDKKSTSFFGKGKIMALHNKNVNEEFAKLTVSYFLLIAAPDQSIGF